MKVNSSAWQRVFSTKAVSLHTTQRTSDYHVFHHSIHSPSPASEASEVYRQMIWSTSQTGDLLTVGCRRRSFENGWLLLFCLFIFLSTLVLIMMSIMKFLAKVPGLGSLYILCFGFCTTWQRDITLKDENDERRHDVLLSNVLSTGPTCEGRRCTYQVAGGDSLVSPKLPFVFR